MYSNYNYRQNVHYNEYRPYQGYPFQQQSTEYYNRMYPAYPYPYQYYTERQQPIQGQATWTRGGQVTQCGIPWSHNEYMTAAVGVNSPYQCGQIIKVKYPTTQRELLLTVVDKVSGYPPSKINIHQKAFEALGANVNMGIIDVEITPSPDLEKVQWGKYLLEVTQAAYPSYSVIEYRFVGKTEVSPTQTKETYEFILESPQEKTNIQGTVIYNPTTDRVISFDIKEV
jgi:hypothetical protein